MRAAAEAVRREHRVGGLLLVCAQAVIERLERGEVVLGLFRAGLGHLQLSVETIDRRKMLSLLAAAILERLGAHGVVLAHRRRNLIELRALRRRDLEFGFQIRDASFDVRMKGACRALSLIHISEPTRQAETSYAA